MTATSSIKAYHEILGKGLLSKARMKTYKTLVRYGPGTAQELHHIAQGDIDKVLGKMPKSDFSSRLSELRTMGVATTLGIKECSITKMHTQEWVALDALPKDIPKQTSTPKLKCSIQGPEGSVTLIVSGPKSPPPVDRVLYGSQVFYAYRGSPEASTIKEGMRILFKDSSDPKDRRELYGTVMRKSSIDKFVVQKSVGQTIVNVRDITYVLGQ